MILFWPWPILLVGIIVLVLGALEVTQPQPTTG